MSINLDKWVIQCDDHYKIVNEYIDDVNLQIYYYTKPTAQPARATQFDTEAEAQTAINNLSNEITSIYKPVQLKTINEKEKQRIDKESDDIIRNAWSNTSDERKKEMLDEIRETKGEEGVQEWLNKYERSDDND
jgi:1,2-phenylacetyl-CoA epoxidase catalytic subunit